MNSCMGDGKKFTKQYHTISNTTPRVMIAHNCAGMPVIFAKILKSPAFLLFEKANNVIPAVEMAASTKPIKPINRKNNPDNLAGKCIAAM